MAKAINTGSSVLDSILPEWYALLQGWAQDGSLVAAAEEALMLKGTKGSQRYFTASVTGQENRSDKAQGSAAGRNQSTGRLQSFVAQFSAGNMQNIPKIVVLPDEDMRDALGAYAGSTNTIYLKATWLEKAGKDAVISVLNEELGEFLDASLNHKETAGDAGEYFAKKISGETLDTGEIFMLRKQSDDGVITVQNEPISVQLATTTPIVRGTSLYVIAEGQSDWDIAQSFAKKIGGNLTTINDSSENSFLVNQFSYRRELFIGYTDSEKEGTWKWIDGSTSLYSNWLPGEPSGDGNYGMMWLNVSDNKSVTGYWNDYDRYSPLTIDGIAEVPFVRYGDSAYVIVQGPTWEDAELNAQRLGGHLAAINSADENLWLTTTFRDYNAGYSQYWSSSDIYGEIFRNDIYWIGLAKDTNNQWHWSSGDTTNYRSWGPGEPFNNGDKAQIVVQAYSGAGYWFETAGNWNDAPAIDPFYGIAEIKLAPNSSSQGSVLISGDPSVGKTVTLDYSTITDPDNIFGWLPAYKVGWETSLDNISWVALMSIDATDGNNSLYLTDPLAGLNLRGVLKYTDGLGSIEILTSSSKKVATENDVFTAFGENNFIDGGVGYDKLIYSGNQGNITVSGTTGSSKVESISSVKTGKTTNTSVTPLASLSNIESIQVNGGISNNIINAGGGTTLGQTRSAFNGTFIANGGTGVDTITGGSYRNWLAGRGFATGVLSGVETITGTTNIASGAMDVFDLRKDGLTGAAYVGGGSADYAKIANFNVGIDKLALTGQGFDYKFVFTQVSSGGKVKAVTDEYWAVSTAGGDLIAQVRGTGLNTIAGFEPSNAVLYGTGDQTTFGLGF